MHSSDDINLKDIRSYDQKCTSSFLKVEVFLHANWGY